MVLPATEHHVADVLGIDAVVLVGVGDATAIHIDRAGVAEAVHGRLGGVVIKLDIGPVVEIDRAGGKDGGIGLKVQFAREDIGGTGVGAR